MYDIAGRRRKIKGTVERAVVVEADDAARALRSGEISFDQEPAERIHDNGADETGLSEIEAGIKRAVGIKTQQLPGRLSAGDEVYASYNNFSVRLDEDPRVSVACLSPGQGLVVKGRIEQAIGVKTDQLSDRHAVIGSKASERQDLSIRQGPNLIHKFKTV